MINLIKCVSFAIPEFIDFNLLNNMLLKNLLNKLS
jgi:hypothetical protein